MGRITPGRGQAQTVQLAHPWELKARAEAEGPQQRGVATHLKLWLRRNPTTRKGELPYNVVFPGGRGTGRKHAVCMRGTVAARVPVPESKEPLCKT